MKPLFFSASHLSQTNVQKMPRARVVGVTEIVKDADGLDDPGDGFGAKSGYAGGHHCNPSAKFWRSSSFSARMRAVLLSMTDLQIL